MKYSYVLKVVLDNLVIIKWYKLVKYANKKLSAKVGI